MALAPCKRSDLAPSCQRSGPTEISGQEALGTRNSLSMAREPPGLGVPGRGPAQHFPDIWASSCVCGQGGGGAVRGGRDLFKHLFLTFLKPSQDQAQRQATLGLRDREETVGIGHHLGPEGARECTTELIFTGSLLQWRPLAHKRSPRLLDIVSH